MLLQEQLLACQADADKPSNAQQIESSAPAWAHHGASLARQQWLVHTSAQLKADAAAKALASAADPAFAAALRGKRGFDIKAIIERAAKKIKDETKAKADQVEAKRQDLVRQAGIEYLRLSFGKKQKPAPNVLQEKLGKACKCSKSLPPGKHKEGCTFHPTNLRSKTLAVDRAAIDKQLRERTSLTFSQRIEAVDHLFSSEQAAASSSSSSSSSSKGPSFLKTSGTRKVCV